MSDDPRLQPYRVDVVAFDTALAELRAVRDEVFVGEQGVPITLEHDALDPLCTHVLARLLDGSPVGTARLTPDRHIGRMAVRAAWRGRAFQAVLGTAGEAAETAAAAALQYARRSETGVDIRI